MKYVGIDLHKKSDLSWRDLELPACLPWACHFLAWSAWKSPIRPLAVPTSKSAANATTNPGNRAN